MYAFLLKPRWLLGHVIALGLITLFINFGFWQLRRFDWRLSYNNLLEERLATEPQPFELLATNYQLAAEPENDMAAVYRRTVATGWFDTENEILLRSRSFEGQPGYHVLTPLVLESDRALLVNRGWVPYELDEPPVAEAAPPEGELRVEGILFPAQEQPSGLAAKDPPEGDLQAAFWIDIDRLGRQMPYGLEPLYLQLSVQTPAQEKRLPLLLPEPELSPGSHLGYAIQWFSFALIGIVGYSLLLRKTAQELAAGK